MSEAQAEQKTGETNKGETKQNTIDDVQYEILPEDYSSFDLSFKLIVIGDSGVGKSCLTNNAIKNTFEETYNATVGFEFFTFNIKLNNKIVKLQIWDTCGQELYRSLITNFYRNTSLAIMVYSINSKDSFDNIEMWLRELRTHSNPDAKVFLIGNKVDLESEREVKTEQGEAYSKTNKCDLFMETSAKTGLNAQNVFIKAAKLLLDNFNQYEDRKRKEGDIESDELSNEPAPPQKLQGTKNNSNTDKGKEKKKCC
jgi:Ras-related protein Rab-11A